LNTAILTFEVVPVETAGQELLALAGNFVVACAAFDTWVALRPGAWIELRRSVIWQKGAPASSRDVVWASVDIRWRECAPKLTRR
jgi:hypothetical protein